MNTANDTTTRVEEALARDGHGLIEITAYCEATDCAAREIVINIKDHDQTLLEMLEANGLRCSVCGRPAKLHGVQTYEERQTTEDREARVSVNQQMYRRGDAQRVGGDPATVAVPLSVFVDDRLPPTPTGWFEK